MSAPGHRSANGGYRLYDMHCHIDRMANAREAAAGAEELGIAILDAPVTPGESLAAQEALRSAPNVRVAVGLHPWWVADGTAQGAPDRAALLAAGSRFVGEVGLDFSNRHRSSAAQQDAAFELIVRACAERHVEGRVVSIHAVRAATRVLDILERYGLPARASCIFHWFSGTGDELVRARRMGCYFSVNERMLASRRGREYARQVPAERLLLETDAPPRLDAPYSASELLTSLEHTLAWLADIRGEESEALRVRVAETSSVLLGI